MSGHLKTDPMRDGGKGRERKRRTSQSAWRFARDLTESEKAGEESEQDVL
jgi:hypothetical protein